MPSYSGVWTLTAQYQAVGSVNWPGHQTLSGDLGVFAPQTTNALQYINIASTGTAAGFGSLSSSRESSAACGSSTRGLFGGGKLPGNVQQNIIDYITFSTSGIYSTFGELTLRRYSSASAASSTIGVWAGGFYPANNYTNVIDYVTIATTGNASNFGQLTVIRLNPTGCGSTTRGLFGGGYRFISNPGTYYNVIDYITYATTGNATDFGDLTVARTMAGAVSSSTRAAFAGGDIAGSSPDLSNVIDYVTIASTGDAVDFGDLTLTATIYSGMSNKIYGVFGLGSNSTNSMDVITIATTGNATDFGDATTVLGGDVMSSCSNSSGGI